MKIADSKTMRTLDNEAIQSGISSMSLMEHAAYGILLCSEEILGSVHGKRIAVFCGGGNNGGDGIAFSLLARRRGADVRCFLTRESGLLKGDPAAFFRLYSEEGGSAQLYDKDDTDSNNFILDAELIVDAIYGIGFHGSLSGNELCAAKIINRSNAVVAAADIPSGTEADSGLISEDCVIADYTVTFTCLKAAHCIQPAKSVCGKVSLCDIGIPESLKDAWLNNPDNKVSLTDRAFAEMLFPPRSADTHKGNYGKVLVIGGCIGYTGAPYLAASAAFRTGSGLVYMAVPDCIYSIEAVKCNEIICLPFGSDQDGGFSFQSLSRLSELASKCDVCVIGPGLGRSDGSDRLVSGLLGTISCPVILDADGINAVSGNINVLSERAAQKKTTVLTPHDVEFERLGGDRSKGRIQGASELSRRLGAVVVLKGNTTVTAAPDGRAMINTTGNPGMAKGGSGDLLAGVIASLIGRGAEPASAAAAGAFIHGAAGDSAARIFGEYGMLPTDLLNEIPTTLKNGGMA